MSTRTLVFVALALVVAACGSGSSGGGSGTSTNSTEPDDGGGGGGGPCSTGDQDACNACIEEKSKICNAGPCRAEDRDLENCSVMAVYYPCQNEMGDPSIDCCKLEETQLIRCWNEKCPEMQACM